MVEDVEALCPELQNMVFMDFDLLVNFKINIENARALNRIATYVSKESRSGLRISGKTQPARWHRIIQIWTNAGCYRTVIAAVRCRRVIYATNTQSSRNTTL